MANPFHVRSNLVASGLLMFLISTFVFISPFARGADEPRPRYVFYTEFYLCDWSRLAEADEIFETALAPAFEASVEAGVILGWQYLRRALGDEWARGITTRYRSGEDIFSLRQDLRTRISPEHSNALNDFFKVCGPHRENIYSAIGQP